MNFLLICFLIWQIIITKLSSKIIPCNQIINGSQCVVSQSIQGKDSLELITNLTLLIKNVNLTCQMNSNCTIIINSKNNITIMNSFIKSNFINISSNYNFELINSKLSTNGTIGKNLGTSENSYQGNSYFGLGAICSNHLNPISIIDKSYGRLKIDNLLNLDKLKGSGSDNPSNYGGGVIMLNVSNMLLNESEISSSGFPLVSSIVSTCDNPNGGTGGSILIYSNDIVFEGKNSLIAEGGYGGYSCNNGKGGGGGRLMINSSFSNYSYIITQANIVLNGGSYFPNQFNISDEYCRNGATGVFILQNDVFISTYEEKILNPFFIHFDDLKIFNINVINANISIKTINTTLITIKKINFAEKSFFSDYWSFVIQNSLNLIFNYQILEEIVFQNSVCQLQINTNFVGEIISFVSSKLFLPIIFQIYNMNYTNILESEISPNFPSLDNKLIVFSVMLVFQQSNLISTRFVIASLNNFVIDGSLKSLAITCTLEHIKDAKFFSSFLNETKHISLEYAYNIWINKSSSTIPTVVPFQQKYLDLLSDMISNNYTAFVFSQGDITINPMSSLTASKIGLFCNNLDVLPESTISSTNMGCGPYQGIGNGTKIFNAQYECGGTGGNYGGFQGFGLGEDLEKSHFCREFALDLALKYGDPLYPAYQGSGGGGENAGNGGGIIYMLIASLLYNEGIISSKGGDSNPEICKSVKGSGAGAGGSIQIYLNHLNGGGIISSDGGKGYDYCGEGGGGRVLLFFNNWYMDGNIESYLGSSILITAQSGERINSQNLTFLSNNDLATNGTTFSSPCTVGYFSYQSLCKVCPESYFKDTAGYEECSVCRNKPTHAKYTNNTGVNTSLCDYYCDEYYGLNGDDACRSLNSIYITYIDSTYSAVVIFVIFFIYFSGHIFKKYMNHRLIIKDENLDELEEELNDPEKLEKLKNSSNFFVNDLFFHVHRINIYGTNRFDNKWFLKSEPPEEIVYLVDLKHYGIFVNKFNKCVSWHRFSSFTLRALSVLHYPIYIVMLYFMRRKKYKRMVKFLQKYENYFLKASSKELNIKLKLSSSRDWSLAFLDILCYKNKNNKFFDMSSPITLMFSGEGSFVRPFYIDSYAPYFYSLYLSLLKKVLSYENDDRKIQQIRADYNENIKNFLLRINKIACRIEFSSSGDTFLHAIWDLTNFIDNCNVDYFNKFGFKIDLILFQIPKEKFSSNPNSITLLENKDFKNFKIFIKDEVYKIKSEYSLYDVRFGLFILNLETEEPALLIKHRRISFLHEDEEMEVSNNNNDISNDEDILSYKDSFKRKQLITYKVYNNPKSPFNLLNKNTDIFDYIKKKNRKNVWKMARRILHVIRYLFISHKTNNYLKKSTIYMVLSALIMADMFFNVFFWINIFFLKLNEDFLTVFCMYPFAILISPILGVFWISCRSYTVGKTYLIYNYMSGANILLNIILILVNWKEEHLNLWLKIGDFFVKIIISYFGGLFLTHVRKKED